jgi:hypothetical protein
MRLECSRVSVNNRAHAAFDICSSTGWDSPPTVTRVHASP